MKLYVKPKRLFKSIPLLIIAIAIILPAFISSAAFAETRNNIVPDRYLTECPLQGEIHEAETDNGLQMYIWTPYNYNRNVKYEVVLLLNGSGGNLTDWLTKQYKYNRADITLSQIYDWITYDYACLPFIVVTISNYGTNTTVDEICDALSYTADNYSTYATDGQPESIIAVREHFTVGGLSLGSIYSNAMIANHPEYAANYILLSGHTYAGDAVENLKTSGWRLNNVFVGCGVDDERFFYGSRNACNNYMEYCNKCSFFQYSGGHYWSVWIECICDALPYVIGRNAPERDVLFAIRQLRLETSGINLVS